MGPQPVARQARWPSDSSPGLWVTSDLDLQRPRMGPTQMLTGPKLPGQKQCSKIESKGPFIPSPLSTSPEVGWHQQEWLHVARLTPDFLTQA